MCLLPTLTQSKELLLEALTTESRLTLIWMGGNLGDELILAGLEQMLEAADVAFTTRPYWKPQRKMTGIGAIVGCGGWCSFYSWSSVLFVKAVTSKFKKAVILPSTFDTSDAITASMLREFPGKVFAREMVSYKLAKVIRPDVMLVHDTSFLFNYRPYMKESGKGDLFAFRTDSESLGFPLPRGNRDIALEFGLGLDGYLSIIAKARRVYTDRAHVMIAAALMGKEVHCRDNSYFKVRSFVETWLRGYPVYFDC